MIPLDKLNEILRYENGLLYWTDKAWRRVRNKIAGTVNNAGYRQLRIDGHIYLEHRIIFYMHYGYLPKMLDHIDGNPKNNIIANLRECTRQQNSYNSAKRNRLLPKGVTWSAKDKRYQAQLSIGGKNKYLGQYKTIDEAERVVQQARQIYHGEFYKE